MTTDSLLKDSGPMVIHHWQPTNLVCAYTHMIYTINNLVCVYIHIIYIIISYQMMLFCIVLYYGRSYLHIHTPVFMDMCMHYLGTQPEVVYTMYFFGHTWAYDEYVNFSTMSDK